MLTILSVCYIVYIYYIDTRCFSRYEARNLLPYQGKIKERIMESTQRLNSVQAKLQGLGYVDVKFFFKRSPKDLARSDLENNLASLLNKFVDGEHEKSSFDDSFLVAEPQSI